MSRAAADVCRRKRSPPSLQDTVIRWIGGDLADGLRRTDHVTEPSDLRYRFVRAPRLPAELFREHTAELDQQRPRRDELHAAFEGETVHVLWWAAGKDERGDENVGVEDDPQPRRASAIRRSMSRSVAIPSRLARAAP